MKIPITQSEAWKTLQDDLGEKSFLKKTANYHYLAIKKFTPVGSYLYLPYGPIVKNELDFKDALESLNKLAKKEDAVFIRIEPQYPEIKNQFPKNIKKSTDLNPKHTWILDLTPEKAEIIKNFSQGTRTRYNTFSKKGLKVRSTNNPEEIDSLVNLQHKLAKERKINTFSKTYLKNELRQPFSTLYIVEYLPDSESLASEKNDLNTNLPRSGQILAASLFFDYDDTRYYMQSAADSDYKKLPATVALLTKAIFDAKEKGIKKFDFWGIAPENAPKNHPWKGFTEFKKSFGGQAVEYAGTYDIILKPAKYKLYEIVRKLNRLRRRV